MIIRWIGVPVLLAGCLLAQTKTKTPTSTNSVSNTPSEQSSVPAPAKVDPLKEADIRKLMDLVGTRSLVMQVMDGMEQNIKPMMTSALPPGEYRTQLVDLFFDKFHAKADAQHLMDLAVPIYAKYYSRQEIKDLVRFYQTPLGQKTIVVLPKLMSELQDAGRIWGEGAGRDSMIEVLSEHPELAKGLEEAKRNTQSH